MSLDIQPLTQDRLPDLAALFGQGGDPTWCWCAYFRVRGRDWTNSTAAMNRAVLTDAVGELAGDGRAPGLVAYEGEQAVGQPHAARPRARAVTPRAASRPDRRGPRRAGSRSRGPSR